MRRTALRLAAVVAAVALSAPAAVAQGTAPSAAPSATDAPILRGAPVPAGAATPLAEVLAAPDRFAGKPLIVEGVVTRACKMEGCWMQLAPSTGQDGMRVTFKDHAFFVPLNSAGMRARAEGVVQVKKHSKAQADHLVAEGAKLERDADGGATEVSFLASGVELRK